MTKLREMIEDAISKIATYRNPDISDTIEKIDEIFEALGFSKIMYDNVEDMWISDDDLHIETSYFCRGCSGSDIHILPMIFVDSENPIYEAKLFRFVENVKNAKLSVARAKSQLENALIAESKAESELLKFKEEFK